MPRAYNEGRICCPFYQSIANKSISCEGITDDCTTKLLFKSSDKMNQHRVIFCEKKYENCEVFRMLEDKYKDI